MKRRIIIAVILVILVGGLIYLAGPLSRVASSAQDLLDTIKQGSGYGGYNYGN